MRMHICLDEDACVRMRAECMCMCRGCRFNSLALSASEEAMRIAQYGHAAVPQIAPAVV